MSDSDIFCQVRQAHRICAAYYQRVLPRINRVADKLGAQFIQWTPISFDKPPSKSTVPFEHWGWRFLPLLDVSFTFGKKISTSSNISPLDYILDIRLISDSELSLENREEIYGDDIEPDACQLKNSVENSESYLAIYLFSSSRNIRDRNILDRLWRGDYPKLDTGIVEQSDDIKRIGFKHSLSVLQNDEDIDILERLIEEYLVILREY
ncbi:hypothetical protein C9426_35280 [Serratia sp. S1B]|nr:hypothetical protein C9426_35280 [Serratia sp. S1B]